MTTSHRRLAARPTTSVPLRFLTSTAMTISSQVSVPSTFFASSSNYYSFKMQAGCYSCKNLTLEMDLTNTSTAAVQLVPAPMLVNYVRITTGSGGILQTLYGEELWGYLAMTSNNIKMTNYQYITNTSPTTFQSAGTIAAGASVTTYLCCYHS